MERANEKDFFQNCSAGIVVAINPQARDRCIDDGACTHGIG
jgi:hypothetical protein